MSEVPQWSGREIRALREDRHVRAREFAACLVDSERTVSAVSRWEKGAIRPDTRPPNEAK
jgi:DNA-binding transcriptional regulator YiaG